MKGLQRLLGAAGKTFGPKPDPCSTLTSVEIDSTTGWNQKLHFCRFWLTEGSPKSR